MAERQSTMFETFDEQQLVKAAARRTDPSTSHEAARQVEQSGTAASQRSACLAAVRDSPGATSAEIGSVLGMGPTSRHIAGRRLPELADAGLVRRGPKRRCRVNGTMAIEWWPV